MQALSGDKKIAQTVTLPLAFKVSSLQMHTFEKSLHFYSQMLYYMFSCTGRMNVASGSCYANIQLIWFREK
jgi:hypothetical protein